MLDASCIPKILISIIIICFNNNILQEKKNYKTNIYRRNLLFSKFKRNLSNILVRSTVLCQFGHFQTIVLYKESKESLSF